MGDDDFNGDDLDFDDDDDESSHGLPEGQLLLVLHARILLQVSNAFSKVCLLSHQTISHSFQAKSQVVSSAGKSKKSSFDAAMHRIQLKMKLKNFFVFDATTAIQLEGASPECPVDLDLSEDEWSSHSNEILKLGQRGNQLVHICEGFQFPHMSKCSVYPLYLHRVILVEGSK